MVEFKSYCSIENTYNVKNINFFKSHNPNMDNVQYYIEEKIHGANFQVRITEDTITYGKRTSFLSSLENFYDHLNVVKRPEFVKLFTACQQHIKDNPIDELVLFGEIFGQGVQKGVQYSDKKEILFFDIKSNGSYVSPIVFRSMMCGFDSSDLVVPTLGIAVNLQEAVNWKNDNSSLILGIDDNVMEGIVIKPIKPMYTLQGSRVIMKSKNDIFKEKSHVSKTVKTKAELTNEQQEFLLFINRNRVDTVISKHGEFNDIKNMGKCIKLVLADALEDYVKEHPEAIGSEKAVSKIGGGTAAKILHEILIENGCIV
jgi:Rnl2 family RNA ligase